MTPLWKTKTFRIKLLPYKCHSIIPDRRQVHIIL